MKGVIDRTGKVNFLVYDFYNVCMNIYKYIKKQTFVSLLKLNDKINKKINTRRKVKNSNSQEVCFL